MGSQGDSIDNAIARQAASRLLEPVATRPFPFAGELQGAVADWLSEDLA